MLKNVIIICQHAQKIIVYCMLLYVTESQCNEGEGLHTKLLCYYT